MAELPAPVWPAALYRWRGRSACMLPPSGLGQEAQQAAVDSFVRQHGGGGPTLHILAAVAEDEARRISGGPRRRCRPDRRGDRSRGTRRLVGPASPAGQHHAHRDCRHTAVRCRDAGRHRPGTRKPWREDAGGSIDMAAGPGRAQAFRTLADAHDPGKVTNKRRREGVSGHIPRLSVTLRRRVPRAELEARQSCRPRRQLAAVSVSRNRCRKASPVLPRLPALR
jgi:hypothetical protein